MSTDNTSTRPIRIDAKGHWLHEGDPIARAVSEQFAKRVVPCSDGHYELTWNGQRQAIDVEDTPYFVRNLTVQAEGGSISSIELEISDGAHEMLDPTTLMQAGQHILYCRVLRNGFAVPCRFAPSLYHLLAEHIEASRGRYVLPMGGHAHPIRRYQGAPQKAD